MVWTRHRESWTHRLLVFLKTVRLLTKNFILNFRIRKQPLSSEEKKNHWVRMMMMSIYVVTSHHVAVLYSPIHLNSLDIVPQLLQLDFSAQRDVTSYLQVSQRHLCHTELAAGLSVFTFPAQMVGNLFPHHSLLTFTQRTRYLEERTHIQVVLQTDR